MDNHYKQIQQDTTAEGEPIPLPEEHYIKLEPNDFGLIIVQQWNNPAVRPWAGPESAFPERYAPVENDDCTGPELNQDNWQLITPDGKVWSPIVNVDGTPGWDQVEIDRLNALKRSPVDDL